MGKLSLAFDRMAEQVEKTISTLRHFVADAAHELHTPLTALQTNLELALDEQTLARQNAFVKRAYVQVKRLESVTNGLLDLSRIEGNAVYDNRRRISLSSIIQDESEVYASRSEQAEVNFVLNLPEEPITLNAIPEQIRSAVVNLLDNALKFTPAGETITVTVNNNKADNVHIEVQDSGIGIPENELPNIYRRFYRCHNASQYPGSGLGLAIVKCIAEAHGGEIQVNSNGSGTKSTLVLPVTNYS